jgi:hypothetical protein
MDREIAVAMLTTILSLALLIFPVDAPLDVDDPLASDISTWIENLGAEDWSLREEAARKLLDAGPDAIDALRSSLQDPDPEVRARVKEMLSLLAPPILIVDVVRVGNLSDSSQLSARQEVVATAVRFTRSDLVQTSVTSTSEERRIQVEVRGSEAPYSVEILFPGVNSTIVSGPPARGLDPGIPWVILSEERITMEQAQGKTSTRGELASWVAVLHHDPEPALEKLDPALRVAQAIRNHLPRSDDPHLWLLAGVWPQLGPIPDAPEGAAARVRDARLVSLLGHQDASAVQELTSMVARHLDGIESISTDRIDVLIPALLEANIDRSIELLSRHCGDLSPWRQHLSWHSLERNLGDPEFASAHGKTVIQAIMAPEALPVLRWTNSRLASLWSTLQQHVPTEQWMEVLQGRVKDALGQDMNQSTGRIPLILGTMAFLSNRSELLPPEWQTQVAGLIGTRHSEIALGVLASQQQEHGVSEEIWAIVCGEMGKGLASTDTTTSFRVRKSVARLIDCTFLSPGMRRILLEVLVDTIEEVASQRSSADQLLTKSLGATTTKPIRTRDPTYWNGRAKLWKKKLEDLPDDQLYPAIEAGEWVRLTLADYRIDPEGTTEPLRLQRLVLQIGHRFLAIGDNGEDESILIVSTHGNTYRLSGSILVVENRPVLARLRPRWRRWIHRISSARLGPESAQARSLVTYQTLALMEPLDANQAQQGQGLETDPGWDDIEALLLDGLNSAEQTTRRSTIDIVTTLKLVSAREPLIKLWKDDPTPSIARALLVLGDTRGRYMLFESIKQLERRATRDAQQAMEQLLLHGDRETMELVLSWLERPPTNRTRILENQLPIAMRSIESWISKQQDPAEIPMERLIGALVQRCDTQQLRGTSIPLLRRLTGQDMGWWNTFSITDTKERMQAQEEIAERWNAWWQRTRERSQDPVKLNPPRDR